MKSRNDLPQEATNPPALETNQTLRELSLGGAPLSEGIVFEKEVNRKIFNLLKNPNSPKSQIVDVEKINFIEQLICSQHDGCLETLRLFNLYIPKNKNFRQDVPPPSLDLIKQIFIASITNEQFEILLSMGNPVLQIVPITSITRYIKALNSYKLISNQKNAYISPKSKTFLDFKEDSNDENEKISGWEIAITEGKAEPDLLDTDEMKDEEEWIDNNYKTRKPKKINSDLLYRRIRRLLIKYEEKGFAIADLRKVLLIMMNSLKEGNPANHWYTFKGTSTITRAPSPHYKEKYFITIAWDHYKEHVCFLDYLSRYIDRAGRFRLCLEKKINSLY